MTRHAVGFRQQQVEWSDTSRHQTTLVTVEDDMRLEVLDWGGAGPVLLLLCTRDLCRASLGGRVHAAVVRG